MPSNPFSNREVDPKARREWTRLKLMVAKEAAERRATREVQTQNPKSYSYHIKKASS